MAILKSINIRSIIPALPGVFVIDNKTEERHHVQGWALTETLADNEGSKMLTVEPLVIFPHGLGLARMEFGNDFVVKYQTP